MTRRFKVVTCIVFALALPSLAPAAASAGAFTSTANGNWSSTSTWGGTGPPGSGDTVTLGSNVTVDTNVTVGSSPNTGGTAAVAFGTGSGYTLTIAAGKTLTALGDVIIQGAYLTNATLVMSAGSSVILKPPSGQQYKIDCSDNNSVATIAVNGTTGSRCALRTDTSLGGLNGYINTSSGVNRNQGLVTASSCDFSNLGTSSQAGVATQLAYPANTAASITNCTFTNSNGSFLTGNSWDGNLTFQGNSFASSAGATLAGISGSCYSIAIDAPASSGTRLVDTSAFDLTLVLNAEASNGLNGLQLTNSSIAGGIRCVGSAFRWLKCDGNLLAGPAATVNPVAGPSGDVTNNFVFINDSRTSTLDDWGTNPANSTGASVGLAGNIYYSNGNNAAGEAIIVPGDLFSSATTVTIKYNIVLPNGYNGQASCYFFSCPRNTSNLSVVIEHNTACVEGSGGLETGDSQSAVDTVDRYQSYRANLFWGTGGTGSKVTYQGTLTDLVPPSVADYNGGYLLAAGSGSGTHSGNGYQGNYSATPGTHDLSANPQFVDPTVSLAKWGFAHGSGAPTDAAALVLIASDPSLVKSSLLPYLRAGYAPTNSAYRAASFPGDTSTTDAAGNAWPGAGPGIGAMGFAAARAPVPVINGPFRRRTSLDRPGPHTPRLDLLDTTRRRRKVA